MSKSQMDKDLTLVLKPQFYDIKSMDSGLKVYPAIDTLIIDAHKHLKKRQPCRIISHGRHAKQLFEDIHEEESVTGILLYYDSVEELQQGQKEYNNYLKELRQGQEEYDNYLKVQFCLANELSSHIKNITMASILQKNGPLERETLRSMVREKIEHMTNGSKGLSTSSSNNSPSMALVNPFQYNSIRFNYWNQDGSYGSYRSYSHDSATMFKQNTQFVNMAFCHCCSRSVDPAEMADHYLSEQHQNTILRFLTSGQFADMDQTALSVSKIQGNMDITLINDNVNTRMQSLELMYNAARCLRNDFTDLQKKMSDIQQEIKSLERSFQERTVFFDEQKYNQDILQQNIEELRQKLEDKQYIPYDGSYTWEIKDVQKRLFDALSQQRLIYSLPFYSSPTGYKMRALLCPWRNANAQYTHMSLYFMLMQGEYDNILKFPFEYSVAFCLYDQTGQNRHIINSFRPDTTSNSFQRPCSEMNIPSGIPQFCPLEIIQRVENPFVKNDTMFIKILVDFYKLPLSVLLNKLIINPALPTYVVQILIDEKRQEYEQLQQLNDTILQDLDYDDYILSQRLLLPRDNVIEQQTTDTTDSTETSFLAVSPNDGRDNNLQPED